MRFNSKILRFLSAQTISLLGSSLVQYGLIWYITLTSQSGLMLTIATICGFLPQVVVALFAGSIIDKSDVKKVIIISDSCIAFATLLLFIIFLSGYKSLWLIFVVLAIRSAGTGMQTPCVNTIIPLLVDKNQLMRVNGVNSTLGSIILFLSPAISGVLMSFASLEALLLVDVITAVIGVSITSTIAIHRSKSKEDESLSQVQESRFGMQYIKTNANIKYVFLYQLIILFLITPAAILTPLLITRIFGSEIWKLTLGEMTYSLGMIAGGFIISIWGGFSNRIKTMQLAGLLYGVLMLGLGYTSYFFIYLLFNTCIGIVSPCYSTSFTVYLQEQVPTQMHGRIFSFMQIVNACALPLGMCVFGPLADYLSISSILMACGILVILVTFVFKRKSV